MNHFTLPALREDQPAVVLLHVGSNDINNQTKVKINDEKLTWDIINIVKSCKNIGVKKVVISMIFPKTNIALTPLIRQVIDYLWNSVY